MLNRKYSENESMKCDIFFKRRQAESQNIEFERCIDFLVRMIDKYGEEVLRELEEEKQNKKEKEAAVS